MYAVYQVVLEGQAMDQVKGISVIAFASVLLTVVIWLISARLMPPAFDSKETTLLFFVCFVVTYLVVWCARKFRKTQ